jgi:hypothetical protein
MWSRVVLYVSCTTAVLAAWLGHCGGQAFRREIAPPPSHCPFTEFAAPLIALSLFTSPWLVIITTYRETHYPLQSRVILVVCFWALMLVHIYGLLPAVQ